ncbi:hypothetical protein TWF730_008023 [Orbilia blumenaviensis]|uniref:Uncharacterized protein n=1 Tax=Orbilia blumenaviensis TaxID=1796055 RepID=A0AAV9VCS1_9PEZI
MLLTWFRNWIPRIHRPSIFIPNTRIPILPKSKRSPKKSEKGVGMAVQIRSRKAVDTVMNMLCKRLPVELVLDIIELAEYFPCTILGSRTGELGAYDQYKNGPTTKTYLVVQIPFLDSEDIDPEANIQQDVGGQHAEPKRRVVQKIIFKTSSHDQGWGGDVGCQGTYTGAYSWISAEIWRKKTANYKDDMQAALSSQAKIVKANGGGEYSQDEGRYHHWGFHHGYTKIGMEEDNDEVDESSISYDYRYYENLTEDDDFEMAEETGPTITREAKKDYYKVGSWVVQKNICAKAESTEHEIVWDAAVDGPGPDVELWDDNYKDGNGKPMDVMAEWLEKGRVPNSKFAKELREGDEVRVIMRAHFGGWSCTMDSCEIQCWWAV